MQFALECQRKAMEASESKEAWPSAFLFADDQIDYYVIDPGMMKLPDKNIMFAGLIADLYDRKGKALCFVSDTWTAQAPDGITDPVELSKWRQSMPQSLEQWPEHLRSEVLLVTGNRIGEVGAGGLQKYKRVTASEIHWEEPRFSDDDGGGMTGRFLLDLRTAGKWSAVMQALQMKGVREKDVREMLARTKDKLQPTQWIM
jgi:hypothetical protein